MSSLPNLAFNEMMPEIELKLVSLKILTQPEMIICKNSRVKEVINFIEKTGGLREDCIKDFSTKVCSQLFLNDLGIILASVSDEQLEKYRKCIFSEDYQEISELVSYIKAFPSEKHEAMFNNNFIIKMLILIRGYYSEDKDKYNMMVSFFIYILPFYYYPV